MIKKHTAAIAAFISLASFTTINASAADNSTALSHSSGYYDNSQLVTVVNYDDETDIYFTTDGSKPGTDSALYDGTPISVSENTVVRIAAYSGEDLINTAKASIKIRTASPSASAESGEYSDAVKVKLTCSDPDAVIYYTTDGSTPTKDSAKDNNHQRFHYTEIRDHRTGQVPEQGSYRKIRHQADRFRRPDVPGAL